MQRGGLENCPEERPLFMMRDGLPLGKVMACRQAAVACSSAAVSKRLRTARYSVSMAFMEICPRGEASRDVAVGSRSGPRAAAN